MRGLGYLLLDSRVELLLVGLWVRCRGFEVGVATSVGLLVARVGGLGWEAGFVFQRCSTTVNP